MTTDGDTASRKTARKRKKAVTAENPAFVLDDSAHKVPADLAYSKPATLEDRFSGSDETPQSSESAHSSDMSDSEAEVKLQLNIANPQSVSLPDAAMDELEQAYLEEMQQQDTAKSLTMHDRYFVEKEDVDDLTITCTRCAETGHTIRNCPHTQCSTCGQLDDHEFKQCPRNIVCRNCGGRGHVQAYCEQSSIAPRLNNACEYCGKLSHASPNCPTLWRMYQEIPTAERELPNAMVYACFNCGDCGLHSGHFGTECPQARGHPLRPLYPSAFTSSDASSFYATPRPRWETPLGGPSTYNEPPSAPPKRPNIVNGILQKPPKKRASQEASSDTAHIVSDQMLDRHEEESENLVKAKQVPTPTAPRAMMKEKAQTLLSRLGPLIKTTSLENLSAATRSIVPEQPQASTSRTTLEDIEPASQADDKIEEGLLQRIEPVQVNADMNTTTAVENAVQTSNDESDGEATDDLQKATRYLWIGKLPMNLSEAELAAICEEYGPVEKAYTFANMEFGYVTMRTLLGASTTLKNLSGKQVFGEGSRRVKVLFVPLKVMQDTVQMLSSGQLHKGKETERTGHEAIPIAAEDTRRMPLRKTVEPVDLPARANAASSKVSSSLHVVPLPPSTSKRDLQAAFERFGPLVNTALHHHRQMAFINFVNQADAVEAKRKYDHTRFLVGAQEDIRVNFAKPPEFPDKLAPRPFASTADAEASPPSPAFSLQVDNSEPSRTKTTNSSDGATSALRIRRISSKVKENALSDFFKKRVAVHSVRAMPERQTAIINFFTTADCRAAMAFARRYFGTYALTKPYMLESTSFEYTEALRDKNRFPEVALPEASNISRKSTQIDHARPLNPQPLPKVVEARPIRQPRSRSRSPARRATDWERRRRASRSPSPRDRLSRARQRETTKPTLTTSSHLWEDDTKNMTYYKDFTASNAAIPKTTFQIKDGATRFNKQRYTGAYV